MRLWSAIVILAMLAACGTPQEQCVRRETRDLRVVDGLIKTVRTDLDRGYAIRREAYELPVWRVCRVEKDASGAIVRQSYCWESDTYYRNVPEPIDTAAEQRKLNDLQDQRARLLRIAAPAVARCKMDFPES